MVLKRCEGLSRGLRSCGTACLFAHNVPGSGTVHRLRRALKMDSGARKHMIRQRCLIHVLNHGHVSLNGWPTGFL